MSDALLQQARELLARGRLPEAQKIATQVLEQRRTDADALAILGRIAFQRAQFDLAAQWFQKAVTADRKRAVFHRHLATAELMAGRLSRSLAGFERALKLRPDDADAIAGKAEALERLGKPRRAIATLEPLVRSGRAPGGAVVAYVRSLLSEGRTEDALAAAQTFGQRHDLQPAQRRSLLKLTGRGHASTGDHDAAFEAYRAANSIGQPDFDIARVRAEVDALISVFSPTMLAGAPRGDTETEIPVFVVGMPRSGTTLIEQMIHAHPAAHGAGEIHDLSHLRRVMPQVLELDRPFPTCVPGLTAGQVNQLAESYLQRLRTYAPRAERIVDKSLENHELLGLIQMLYPRARIIHAQRHPMDTCLSCYMQDLSPDLVPYATDLEHLGAYFREHTRLMTHWREVLEMPLLEVPYEDVVGDAQAWSERIIEFIGLPYDDACRRFHEARREVSTASYAQVRQPIYKTAVARYERYAKHLGPLREALGDLADG